MGAERARKQAERELGRLADAAEYSSDAVISAGRDGRVRRWSKGAERLFGYTEQEALGRTGEELSLYVGSSPVAQNMARALAGERLIQFEAQRRRKDGAVIDVLATVLPWREEGAVIGLTGVFVNITERKRAEREFVRLAEAAEYGTDAVVSIDFDGVVRHWNRGAERLLGLSAQEAIGKSIVEVNALTGQPEEANERAHELIARIRRGEPTYHMEARRRREDGGLSHVLVTVTPWHVDGQLAGVTTTSLDITERTRAEQATARLAAIVDASDDAIIGKTLDGEITSWNPAAVHMYGYSAAEAIGRPVSMLAPGREDELASLLASVARGESVSHLERTRRRKDGREIEVSLTVSPVRDRRGQIVGAATIARDITERKAAERELERLAQAAEHSLDAVISVDLDGRICHWSAGAEALLGFSAQEMVGLTMAEWNTLGGEPEEADQRNSEFPARVYAGETVRYEVQRRRKDGVVLDLEATLVPWRVDGTIVGLTSTTADITERKRAERAREQALASLEEAQRLARLGSWTWDPRAGIATWSAQTYELFGRDPASGPAVGEALAAYVHPDDRERIGVFGANPPPGGFEFDFRILSGGDGAEHVLHAIGYPDPARPGCFTGSFQDVSAQRRGEQAQAANQAKSEFLSRMSHELRTPLNAISGFAQLLAMDELLPHQAEHTDYVLKGANHMLALVNDVLDFSRIEAGQLKVSTEPVALLDTVRSALALMEPLAHDGDVRLSIEASGLAERGHVHADAQRLKQVLLNVLSNAIKYNHPGGRVEVSFETVAGTPARVYTRVKDTGIGIAAHDTEKLFEPFERLGAEQRAIDGTGLGLALSKGLIEAMGGTITASSTPGVGSTFAIELTAVPALDAEDARGAPESGHPADAGLQPRRTKILYVEDNVSNLRLVERVLERHATVEMIPAMQGSLGVALAREHHPDMIILDLHLPDVNGEVVLARLKADPSTKDIPVVMLTADASKGLSERLARIGSCEFLSKPLDVPRLLKVITTYSDGAARSDAPCAD